MCFPCCLSFILYQICVRYNHYYPYPTDEETEAEHIGGQSATRGLSGGILIAQWHTLPFVSPQMLYASLANCMFVSLSQGLIYATSLYTRRGKELYTFFRMVDTGKTSC